MNLQEVYVAVLALVTAYVVGGLHGLWFAFTQEHRMRRWARKVVELQAAQEAAEERGAARAAAARDARRQGSGSRVRSARRTEPTAAATSAEVGQ